MMQQKLQELVDRLRKAHRERLVSVILYGSAVSGDHHQQFSDLNVVCVLTDVSPVALADSEPIFKWWRAQGNPTPLLLTEEEVRTSTDCFPIEFHDMAEHRRVLFGKDVIEGLVIDKSFYRAQIEQELRAKVLRLRQKAAAVLTDKKSLLALMLDSVSNFLVLSRHALLVSGVPAGSEKRAIARNLAAIGVDPAPFDALLDLREQLKKPAEVEPEALFAQYLKQIEAVVAHVDRLEK
ncbi:MAG TPA: nucleotidyltransferase domain-containing protein [Bryobacteraceae bacterium]|nr:nucleotidyltransferase domain-containing protein [Bryobacteraceae bacterium]